MLAVGGLTVDAGIHFGEKYAVDALHAHDAMLASGNMGVMLFARQSMFAPGAARRRRATSAGSPILGNPDTQFMLEAETTARLAMSASACAPARAARVAQCSRTSRGYGCSPLRSQSRPRRRCRVSDGNATGDDGPLAAPRPHASSRRDTARRAHPPPPPVLLLAPALGGPGADLPRSFSRAARSSRASNSPSSGPRRTRPWTKALAYEVELVVDARSLADGRRVGDYGRRDDDAGEVAAGDDGGGW